MASSSANRDRYQQYAKFLRTSVDRLNLEVTPGRLQYLRRQVNGERNRFLFWEVLWLLVAVVAVIPVVMLSAVEFDLDHTLPEQLAARANTFYLQFMFENLAAMAVTVASAMLFVAATGVAFAPIILHGQALNELEAANRKLKVIERSQAS